MRASANNKSIAVHAVAGTHTVLLGMDATRAAAKGLLGFAIHREDSTSGKAWWMRNALAFEASDHGADDYSTQAQPIQDFKWSDYATEPGSEYTYRIVPMYGTPKQLEPGDPVSVTVRTESHTKGPHHVFFNRGVAGSQEFERRFGDNIKEGLEKPGSPERKWLSRGLEEALIGFIGEAKGKGWSLRGALYEFTYPEAMKALSEAHSRGVDIKVTFDAKGDMYSENWPAIVKARIKSLVIPRKGVGIAISHNKFLILLKEGKPVAVWTGSTNVTLGGIFGQSNVGHLVRDPAVAATYFEYWQMISENPSRKDLAAWNEDHTPVGPEHRRDGTRVVFSPRGSLEALVDYELAMDEAQRGVFLTAAFGVSKELTTVLVKKKPYLRYLLMDNRGHGKSMLGRTAAIEKNPMNLVAVGDHIREGDLANWHAEHLTGLNEHVQYVHTKFMLIDPLGDQPIVVTGSANFSEPSILKNDENMLVIQGDTRVADIYLSEFMRLYTHFRLRDRIHDTHRQGMWLRRVGKRVVQGSKTAPKALFLAPDDSWAKRFYVSGSADEKDRLHFACTTAKADWAS